MSEVRKAHPRPTITAPRNQPRPSAPSPEPRPAPASSPRPPVSGFEDGKRRPVQLDAHHHHHPRGAETAEGRGTPDDSIGRWTKGGTPDDSIGGDSVHRRGNDTNGVGVARGARVPPEVRARLSPDGQAALDRALSGEHKVRAKNASYVLAHPAFSKLPVEDQEKLVRILDHGGPRTARAVAEFFQHGDGKKLFEKASDGTRLLDSVEKLATAPNVDRPLLGSVLMDLARPDRIWQGRAPTCTVSTMQYELAKEQPAEYARLMAGLAVDGRATMNGGGVLRANADYVIGISEDNADRRSRSEALFQTAAMEFANGADDYKPRTMVSEAGHGEAYRGLHPDQITSMVGQLFGAKYKTLRIDDNQAAAAELNRIVGRERPNRPVLFEVVIDGQYNHLVALERVEGDRVYFRDPSTGKKESMSAKEFRSQLAAVHYAEDATLRSDPTGKPAPAANSSTPFTPFALMKYGRGFFLF